MVAWIRHGWCLLADELFVALHERRARGGELRVRRLELNLRLHDFHGEVGGVVRRLGRATRRGVASRTQVETNHVDERRGNTHETKICTLMTRF